ncbi:hypothetical protein [Chryseobacterium polytrichastri]|uniref:hypothetical protein n=1 Tax=Chryseobacterium polytrichastri TaxID=1302687 RepID=UPI0015875337|nr:hypothetical protein [Chryseobacterium polytrichastri]
MGSTDPLARIYVGSGDIYIDSVGSGVIMKSDDGSCWRVRVTNTGTFTSATIICP